MSRIDYIALARIGITNPDRRPDNSGLDDGPPLPRAQRHVKLREDAQILVANGATLREAADALGVSHETVRVWTEGVTKRRHVIHAKPTP